MDWKRFLDPKVIQRYTSSQAVNDFDKFLDALPLNVGYNALIAMGIMWMIAGGAMFFVSGEVEKVTLMNKELKEVQALQPPIPVLKYVPIGAKRLKEFSERVGETYKGLVIMPRSDGKVVITAHDTDYFPQFISAISYFQRGGKNWKVVMDYLCVGRDCTGSKLAANLKIDVVRIGEPEK